MTQELITPELAAKIQQYDVELQKWGQLRDTQGRGIVYALCLAPFAWAVSFWAAGHTGEVNLGTWFAAVAIFSFVAGLALTGGALIVGVTRICTDKPIRDFKLIKTTDQQFEG